MDQLPNLLMSTLTPNLSSLTFVFSAVVEKLGDPSETPVGFGINCIVFTATGDQAACGITGPAAPGNTHAAVVTQPANQYCSPGVTVYPNRLVKVAAKFVGLLSPRTAPVKSA